MSLTQSLPVAAFCMAVVFAVLAGLWFIIRLSSAFIRSIEAGHAQKNAAPANRTSG